MSKAYSAVLIFLILLSSSCADGKLQLIEANYLYSRGRYEEASASYFKALDKENAAPYAEYGLGLTFQTMDDAEKAFNYYSNSKMRLNAAASLEHRELKYRIHYNTGILFFENNDFSAAAASFKEALKIDPSKIDAKRNMEISLMSIAQDKSKERKPEIHNEMKEEFFDYIKQQEQQYWRSSEWHPEEKSSDFDY